MDIQQNNVAVLHFNLVNQDGSTIFIRKTKLATFNLINPSAVSVPITDIGFDATLNQCWIRVPKESNATTGQYYGVLNIVDDDWGTYTTSKIKIYSVVSDADEDTKSIVFTATCLATQVTNPSGGNSPYYNTTTSTWWQYSDTLKAFEDTGVGNLVKYITKNVQHLKDGTGNGSIVTCLDDEISANNIATGLCSTDLGKNNENRGESCVALGEHNYIAEGVSNATAIAGAQPSAVDVFAVGDKTAGHRNVFEINKYGDIFFRPDSSQERIVILQDILDSVIKNVFYDSSKYSLTVTFYSAAENNNKIKTYDLSGLKAVLKDDAVKEISVNQSTAVMTVNTINGSSQQIQLPTTSLVQSDWNTTDTSADSYILNKPTALSSFANDSGYDTVTSVNSKLGNYLPLTGNAATATKTVGALTITKNGTSVGTFNGSADTTIALTDTTYSDATTTTKGLMTATDKAKLNSISYGAEVNVQSNWSTTDTSADSYILNKPTALSSFDNDSGYDTVTSVNSKLGNYLPLTGGTLTGLLKWNSNSLPSADSLPCILGIDSFASGGATRWCDANNVTVGKAATATKTVGALTVTKNGTSVGTFNGSADTTIALTDTTYSAIQPFDFLDSNERGTFWTQTDTNSIAVAFMTDSKVITNKVRIFIYSTEDANIRCAIYKRISVSQSSVLSLVTHTQLYTGHGGSFVDIPFETITTLDSDALYYLVFERGSCDLAFLGKQINASLLNGFVYKGDAFNADSDTFKSQYPTDGVVDGNIFIPYFKII